MNKFAVGILLVAVVFCQAFANETAGSLLERVSHEADVAHHRDFACFSGQEARDRWIQSANNANQSSVFRGLMASEILLKENADRFTWKEEEEVKKLRAEVLQYLEAKKDIDDARDKAKRKSLEIVCLFKDRGFTDADIKEAASSDVVYYTRLSIINGLRMNFEHMLKYAHDIQKESLFNQSQCEKMVEVFATAVKIFGNVDPMGFEQFKRAVVKDELDKYFSLRPSLLDFQSELRRIAEIMGEMDKVQLAYLYMYQKPSVVPGCVPADEIVLFDDVIISLPPSDGILDVIQAVLEEAENASFLGGISKSEALSKMSKSIESARHPEVFGGAIAAKILLDEKSDAFKDQDVEAMRRNIAIVLEILRNPNSYEKDRENAKGYSYQLTSWLAGYGFYSYYDKNTYLTRKNCAEIVEMSIKNGLIIKMVDEWRWKRDSNNKYVFNESQIKEMRDVYATALDIFGNANPFRFAKFKDAVQKDEWEEYLSKNTVLKPYKSELRRIAKIMEDMDEKQLECIYMSQEGSLVAGYVAKKDGTQAVNNKASEPNSGTLSLLALAALAAAAVGSKLFGWNPKSLTHSLRRRGFFSSLRRVNFQIVNRWPRRRR